MIGLVVDSNSQLPAELAERFAIEVVPLTVSIDGTEYLEGVDLDADGFYAAWEGGHTPEISTSQPAPGEFVAAYTRLADRGVTEILSIHIAAAMSGTLNAARIASAIRLPIAASCVRMTPVRESSGAASTATSMSSSLDSSDS